MMDSWSVWKNKFVQGEHKLWNMSSQMVYLIKKYTCISDEYLTFMLFFLICIVIRYLISPFQVFRQTFSLTFSWHVICHDAVCAASKPMCIGSIFFWLRWHVIFMFPDPKGYWATSFSPYTNKVNVQTR